MSTPTPTPTPTETATYYSCEFEVVNLDCDNSVFHTITAATCSNYLLKLDENSLAEGNFNVYKNSSLIYSAYTKEEILNGLEVDCGCPVTPTPTPTTSMTPTPTVTLTSTPTITTTPTQTQTPSPSACIDDIELSLSGFFRPTRLLLNPTTSVIYLTDFIGSGSGLVYEIDPVTYNDVPVIFGLSSPTNLAFNSADSKIYVSDASGINIYDSIFYGLITTLSGLQSSGGNSFVNAMTYDATNNRIYSASNTGVTTGEIAIIDGSLNSFTLLSGLPISSGNNIIYNSSNNLLYLCGLSNTLTLFDCITQTVTGIVLLSGQAESLTYKSSTNQLFAIYNGGIDVIDCTSNTVTNTWSIPSISQPRDSRFNLVNNKIYITNDGNDSVLVIDVSTGTLNKTTSVSPSTAPIGLEVYTTNNKIFVANNLPSSLANGINVICGSI